MIQTLNLTIKGRISSGKNNLIITRTGLRIPRPPFVKWRNYAIEQILQQLPKDFKPIDTPTSAKIFYWAPDKRRRDAPGIIDAIWHVLERAKVVTDDKLLGGDMQNLSYSNCGLDRKNARVILTLVYEQ